MGGYFLEKNTWALEGGEPLKFPWRWWISVRKKTSESWFWVSMLNFTSACKIAFIPISSASTPPNLGTQPPKFHFPGKLASQNKGRNQPLQSSFYAFLGFWKRYSFFGRFAMYWKVWHLWEPTHHIPPYTTDPCSLCWRGPDSTLPAGANPSHHVDTSYIIHPFNVLWLIN